MYVKRGGTGNGIGNGIGKSLDKLPNSEYDDAEHFHGDNANSDFGVQIAMSGEMTDFINSEVERLSRQRLKAMLDSSPIPCVVVDESGHTLEINKKQLELFGVASKQEYLSKIGQLSPEYQPDGRYSCEKGKEKLKQAFETGSAYFEWMHCDHNGADIPCEMSIVRIDQPGQKLAFAYLRDLRELKSVIRMKEHLEALAYTDPLTGINNRRFFVLAAEKELESSNTEDKPFSLLMLDVDHFKEINDKYGHPIGDEVLRILTKRIKTVLRSDALMARYGGEEFVIMLKNTITKNAMTTAWRIRKTVERTKFSIEDQGIKVTVSIGVASKTSSSSSLEEIIESADAALYKAKNSGRNTVVG